MTNSIFLNKNFLLELVRNIKRLLVSTCSLHKTEVSLSQSPEDRQTIGTVLIKALFPHFTSHFSPIIPRHDDETFPLITSMGQVITTIRHIQIDIYYQNKMQMSLREKNLVS